MTKKLTPEEKAANLAARRAARGAGDKPEKKAKKSAKVVGIKSAKPAKKKSSKESSSTEAGIGHNRGQVNEALQEIFTDYKKLDEDSKAIAKAKRDLRAKAKDEHNVSAANFNHEIKMQKLDNDVRVMFENGAQDLKQMLGIQLSLNLAAGDEEGEEDEDTDAEEAAARAASH